MSRAEMHSRSAPRIVHVIPWDALGGAELAASDMARKADPAGNFKVLLLSGAPRLGSHENLISSSFSSFNNPLAHLDATRRILKAKPDVLISSLWRSIPSSLLAKALRPEIRLVAFLHNERPSNILDRALHHVIRYVADAVWVDSRATLLARLDGNARNRAKIISFVLDRLEPEAPAPGNPSPRFVSWARMDHQKGLDRAIKFIASLVERGVDARFDLWGPDNGLQSRLENLRDRLGLREHVRFRGATTRKHLQEIASENSFYLQLSRREGMAMAVVESMQLGLLPIVTPVGEMAHYCQDGFNSLVCDVENMNQCVDRVAAILSAPDEYREIVSRAVGTWRDAKIYADDIYDSSRKLVEIDG